MDRIVSPLVFTIILNIISTSVEARTLTLDDYLSQVEGKNQNVISARDSARGADLRSSEANLMYSPNLFAEASWMNDRFRNALFPQAYSSLVNNLYSVGVRQNTAYGLNAALSYEFNKLGYLGGVDFVSGAATNREFWEGSPRLELSLSLWRNLFGGETQAQKQVTESSARSAQFNQSYQVKATRAAAESAYVRLVSAQELVRVYSSSVESAQDLLKWINRQVGLRLGDETDLYQAQANMEMQKLNLQTAQDEYRVASRAFNRMRNIDSDEVTDKLMLPSISNLKPPPRNDTRDDVRAAQENARLAAATAKLGYERNLPRFEAFGSLTLNARESQLSNTFSNSWRFGNETTLVGVRLNIPLGLGLSADARKGFELERIAAEKLVQQKTFEQEVEWKDLVQQLEEAQKRYEIAETLAKIQAKKVKAENTRLKRGRTTTYQTVVYNQDYNNAEAARIQAQSNVLNLYARMKTFGGSKQ